MDFENTLAYRIYPIYNWLATHGAPKVVLDMFVPVLCNVFKMKNSTKRIIAYRIVAFLSEFFIVYAVSGTLWIPTVTTPVCLLAHTGLHYLVEKRWKDKSERSATVSRLDS